MSSKSISRSRTGIGEVLARNPILTLETLGKACSGSGSAKTAREKARYYSRTGRLRMLTRRVYAVVPPGADPATFVPDPYLVAAVLRPDAVLSHHAALDLLGVGAPI